MNYQNDTHGTVTSAEEKDAFLFRCLKALEVARTAQLAIEAEETHAAVRLREEELAVEVLQAEIEDIQARWKTASFQVVDIERALESFGIALPGAPIAPIFSAKEIFDQALTNAFKESDTQLFQARKSSHDLPTSPPPASPIRSIDPRSPRSPPSSPPLAPPISSPPTRSSSPSIIPPSQKTHNEELVQVNTPS